MDVVHAENVSTHSSSSKSTTVVVVFTIGWRNTAQQRGFPKEIQFVQRPHLHRWCGFVIALHTHTTTTTDNDVKFIGRVPLLAQNVVLRRFLIRGQFQNGFNGRRQSIFDAKEQRTERATWSFTLE
jgi:hypothetical protein